MKDLTPIEKELLHEVEQLILHAEEGSLDYSVLEHARKLVFKTTHPEDKPFDLMSLFDVISNDDLERFEFKSCTNLYISYTVGYHECDNLADAKIAVYKAIQKEQNEFNRPR